MNVTITTTSTDHKTGDDVSFDSVVVSCDGQINIQLDEIGHTVRFDSQRIVKAILTAKAIEDGTLI